MTHPPPLFSRLRRRIGLLGGSFNPAHAGHRHISLLALRRLGLDELWWLVSPQNPLKPRAGMAALAERVRRARLVARHPRIRVTDLEARLGATYTADTLAVLRRAFPATRFVWLMGADNLAQIHRWDRWRRIFALVPIAVFDRPGHTLRALHSRAAARYRQRRRRPSAVRAGAPPPVWTFIAAPRHGASATAIRKRQESAARLLTRRLPPKQV